MINVFYAEYTLKQWNVNGFHKDAQGPWCQALLTPQYVPSTTQTTWWESSGNMDILYTVSPPRWIEEDWKRIFYLPFIKMNWTIAYKTLLLLNGLQTYYWFLYTFPHIGLFSYHETSIHVLDYYATHTCPVFQLAANQFGEEYICFPSFENLAWISFSSKGIMYASRRLMKRVIIFNDFPILFTEAPLTCGCWLVVLSK